MAKKRTGNAWSYRAGERGRNRVRVYPEPRTGILMLEWYQREPHGRTKRERISLKHRDKEKAKRQADKFAATLAEMVPREPRRVTLRELFDKYLRERTPAKGQSKQKHDRLAERVWAAFFDAQEPSRSMDRRAETLDRTDWERFIEWRREGKIAGWERRVQTKQIKHDLDFLVSVLNWATGQKENGHPILQRNPWDGSIRRAQGWVRPKVQNQKRPAMTDEVRQKLIEHSPSWQLAAALRLGRLTGRRNNSVRQLLWSDIDLQEATVTWHAEKDKAGRETVTLLRAEAVELLKALPSRGIGNAPVFPSEGNPAVPTSSDTFQTWLQRAKKSLLKATGDEAERKRWEIKLAWLGYHAEKRAYVRDPKFRKLDAKVQEILTGTDVSTLRRIYDESARLVMIRQRQMMNWWHDSWRTRPRIGCTAKGLSLISACAHDVSGW